MEPDKPKQMLPGRRESPKSLSLFGWLFALIYTAFAFIGTIGSPANDFLVPPTNVSANIFWLFIYLSAFLLYIVFLQRLTGSDAARGFSFKQAILFSILFCTLLIIPPPPSVLLMSTIMLSLQEFSIITTLTRILYHLPDFRLIHILNMPPKIWDLAPMGRFLSSLPSS